MYWVSAMSAKKDRNLLQGQKAFTLVSLDKRGDHMQGQEMMLNCNSGNPIRFEWAYRFFASYIIVDCVQNLNSDVNWNSCTYCGSTVFMVRQQQDPSKLPGRLTVLLLDLWMMSTLLPYYAQLNLIGAHCKPPRKGLMPNWFHFEVWQQTDTWHSDSSWCHIV